MSSRHGLAAVAATLVLSGCFETTLHNGRPPGEPVVERAWHHAFVFGAVEASGPYELEELCPRGWAELETRSDPAHLLLSLLTLGLYTPQEVTVVCATPGGALTTPPSPIPQTRRRSP
jgi:hypothetical protein